MLLLTQPFSTTRARLAAAVTMTLLAVAFFGLSSAGDGKVADASANAISDKKSGIQTVVGDAVDFGDGEVSSWFSFHDLGGTIRPKALAVRFTDGYLDGWPSAMSDGTYDIYDNSTGDLVWACCGFEVKPPLPAEVLEYTAFEHIVLNLNPHGHPPPMVYTLPHIDMHFYTMPETERLAIAKPADATEMCSPTIPLTCAELALVTMPLPADQQPPSHTDVGAVEPGMGNHLIDLSSPEFNGGTFTNTFIFGANQGNLAYFEPMLTADYLAAQNGTDCRNIDMPAAQPEAGWYPTRYCVRPKQHFTDVTLDKFKWFEASTTS